MPEPATQRSQRARAAWIDGAISALNGAVGDTLHARGNGLEIAMGFHDADGPLALEACRSGPCVAARRRSHVHAGIEIKRRCAPTGSEQKEPA
jgi:hypothetical protein